MCSVKAVATFTARPTSHTTPSPSRVGGHGSAVAGLGRAPHLRRHRRGSTDRRFTLPACRQGPKRASMSRSRTTSERSGESGRVRGGIHHAGAAVRVARHDALATRTGPITWPPGDASVLMDHATDWWWRYAHEPHGLSMTGVQALLWPHPTHVVRGSQSRDGQLRPL